MSSLAVILARGGSKGLKLKSLIEVAGKPLVAWSLEHALGSRLVDDIVLSSDHAGIRDVGRAYGVRVHERPDEHATDTATVDAAARSAVQWWEAAQASTCERAAILYGNIPLRPQDLTDRALAKLAETGADSVQSVFPVGKMHPLWMKRLGGDAGDTLEMYEPNQIYRRQDLPPVYMLDGGVIAVTRASLFTIVDGQPHAFLGTDRRGIVTEPGAVVDVDADLDLAMTEAILRRRAAEEEEFAENLRQRPSVN